MSSKRSKIAVVGIFSVMLSAAGLTGCGGGGGGGSASAGNGGVVSNGDGSWLQFTTDGDDVTVFPGATGSFGVQATSSKTIAETLNAVITDKSGNVDPNISLTAMPGGYTYSALIKTKAGLAPGVHTGTLEVVLCYDAPTKCSRPVEGSPWQVPYKITVMAPGDLHYRYWTPVNQNQPFTGGMDIGSIGSTLVVPSMGSDFTNGVHTLVSETWLSRNDGVTWESLAAPGPTVPTIAYALAGDGTALYLSGGINGAVSGSGDTNAVWKFTGTQWQQKTAAAEFSPRSRHVMVKFGASLYLMGGASNKQPLNDVWTSSDDGAHWTQLPALPKAMGTPTCAVNWRGSMVLIGDTVMTSGDGRNWAEHKVASTKFPFRSMQCGVLNDRLFVNPTDGYSGNAYSTADLQKWQPEVGRPGNPFNVAGMPTVNGHLFSLTGEDTSQRTVYRTEP